MSKTAILTWLGLLAAAGFGWAQETVTTKSLTPLFADDDKAGLVEFARPGTALQVRDFVPERGMYKVSVKKEKTENYLCWPDAVGKIVDVSLERGKIVNITTSGKSALSYPVYLPKSYSPDKPCPVLFVFSNDKNISSAMGHYQNLCDKSGWIAVGAPHLGEGGIEQREATIKFRAVLDDVRRRVPHDRMRVYLAGQDSVTAHCFFLSRILWDEFAGVICLSGWLNTGCCGKDLVHPSRLAAAMTVGRSDAGGLYVMPQDRWILHRSGVVSREFIYGGGHGLPPSDEMQKVFAWLEEDWQRRGKGLAARQSADVVFPKVERCLSLYRKGAWQECADGCLDLMVNAGSSPLIPHVENMLVDIVADTAKSNGIKLRSPEGLNNAAWHIIWERSRGACLRPDWRTAEVLASIAVQLKPEDVQIFPDVFVWIMSNPCIEGGQVSFDKGEYKKAIGQYSLSLQMNSKDYVAYFRRGDAYLAIGEYRRAIADYTSSIQFNPKFFWSLCNRGKAHFFRQDFDRALVDFRSSLQCASPEVNHAMVWIYLAEEFRGKSGRKAIEFLAPKYAKEKAWPEPVLRLLTGKLSLTQCIQAGQDKDMSVSLDNSAAALFYAAEQTLIDGRQEEAKSLLQKSKALKSYTSVWADAELRRMSDPVLLAAALSRRSQPVAAGRGQKPRLVLWPSGAEKARTATDLMHAQFSADDGLVLLDRSNVAKVLQEHSLALAGNLSGDQAVQAGKLLQCDIFAELSIGKHTGNAGTNIQAAVPPVLEEVAMISAFDSVTGVKLCEKTLASGSSTEQLMEEARMVLDAGIRKWQRSLAGEGCKTISFASARDVDLPDDQKGIPNELRLFIERMLIASSDLAVLERRRLGYVNQEAGLTPDMRDRLKASVVLLDLDVSKAPEKGRIGIKALMSDVSGKTMASVSVEGEPGRVAQLAADLCGKIGAVLKVSMPSDDPDMLGRESDRLFAESAFYRKTGKEAQSKECVDAALALARGAQILGPEDRENHDRLLCLLYDCISPSAFNEVVKSAGNKGTADPALCDRTIDMMEEALGTMEKVVGRPASSRTKKAKWIYSGITGFGQIRHMFPQEQAKRYQGLMDRCMTYYRKACLAGEQKLFLRDLSGLGIDMDKCLATYISLYGWGQEPGVGAPETGDDYLWSFTLSNIEALSSSLSPKGRKMLLSFHDDLIATETPWRRLHFRFCAAWLLNKYPDVISNAAVVAESHVRAAADIALADPELMDWFTRGIRAVVPGAEGSSRPQSPNMLLDTAVREMKRVVKGMDEKRKVNTDLFQYLDWCDPKAEQPGMYLRQALDRVADLGYGTPSIPAAKWDGTARQREEKKLSDLYVARYGQKVDARVKVASADGGFQFKTMKSIYSASSDIRTAEISGNQLYLLLRNERQSSYELRRLDLQSGKDTLLGKCDSVWTNLNEMSIGKETIYVPASGGLICFSATGGVAKALSCKAYFSGSRVDSCCEVGDKLYLGCSSDDAGYLIRCKLDGSNKEILAASSRRESKSSLDNCLAYRITGLSFDGRRNRILVFTPQKQPGGVIWSQVLAYWLLTGKIEVVNSDGRLSYEGVVHRYRANGTNVVAYGDVGYGVSFATWDLRDDKIRPLAGTVEFNQFAHADPGKVEAVAAIGRQVYSVYYDVQGRQRWRVFAEIAGKQTSVDLPSLDKDVPLALGEHGNLLVAATRRGVWLLDTEGCEVKLPQDAGTVTVAPKAVQPSEPAPGEKTGRLSFVAGVEGTLKIDGGEPFKFWPDKPLEWNRIKVGNHQLTLKMYGVEVQESVTIREGETTKIDMREKK